MGYEFDRVRVPRVTYAGMLQYDRSARLDRLQINWCANQDLWLHEAEMENAQVEFRDCKLEKGTIDK